MPKYRVEGTTGVYVSIIVEAEDEDEAIEKAYEQEPGLTSFVGNGGMDKLVGVYDEACSIFPDEQVEYKDVTLVGDE